MGLELFPEDTVPYCPQQLCPHQNGEVGQAYWSPSLGRKEEAAVGVIVWGLFWPGREGAQWRVGGGR